MLELIFKNRWNLISLEQAIYGKPILILFLCTITMCYYDLKFAYKILEILYTYAMWMRLSYSMYTELYIRTLRWVQN